MKIMLLSLPGLDERDGNLYPLGLGYLAASLKHDHVVEAYHFNLMSAVRRELPVRLRSFNPEIVGLTCSTFNRGFVKATIKKIKQYNANIKVVVGGVHASFCSDQMINCYGADAVIIGEGERTLSEYCDAIENDLSLESVNGLVFRGKDGLTTTLPREFVRNLDELPLPDYSYAKSFIEKSGMGFIITSRGCPVRCTFCSTSSYWGQNVRMNSVTRVVDEMEMLISKYSVKRIFFHDDTFNLGISRVINICNEIQRRGIQIEWGCSCRVNPVSEEMLRAMVQAGCRHICWGIESGSEEMLKRIDKKISLSQIRNAYALSSNFSDLMSTGAFTMVGNPGETLETIQETVSFLNSIPITDHPSTSILYVLPGTLLYEKLNNDGHISAGDWVKYDTVPYYTIENSFKTLSSWAAMVSASGNLIPFDCHKHFWGNQLCCSNSEPLLNRVLKVLKAPERLIKHFRVNTSAGKISF